MTSVSANSLIDRARNSATVGRLLMLLSGAIYPMGFAPIGLWPLAIASVTLLIYFNLRPASLSPFKAGFYWGIGAFAVGTSWVYVSIHTFGRVPLVGAIGLTAIFVLYLACFKGLFSWLCHAATAKGQPAWLLLIAPPAWLLSELLKSYMLGGFPWLLAGYSQLDSPLSALAPWFGTYGVSWMFVAFASVMALLLSAPTRPIWIALAGLLLSTAAAHWQPWEKIPAKDDKPFSVALVQPNIAQEIKWDRRYFGEILEILFDESAPHWGSDLLVWPEGAIPAYQHQVNDVLAELDRVGRDKGSQLMLGIPQKNADNGESYVAMLGLGESQYQYHKQVLVPFGEYVPLESWLRGAIHFLDLPMSGFTPATTPQQPMKTPRVTYIPAICYEIVYPGIIRDLAIQGDVAQPRLIVTVSNNAWFGDSLGPYQHMQMAQMRSLELGIPLVHGTNDGITAVVDARGVLLASLPRYQQSTLQYQLDLAGYATSYRRYGNSAVWMICAISIAALAFLLWRRRTS